MDEITLYHRKASGTVKVWTCAVDGNLVTRTWGQQGGKMSTTQEKFKANSRETAEERAHANFDKRVQRQKDRGFVRRLDQVIDDIRVSGAEIDFRKPLPSSFAPGKPFKKFDPKQMTEWEREGTLIVQRKRDGMRHFLVSDHEGELKIYSSGKDDVTEHLEPLLKGVLLPPRTILDIELVVTSFDDAESDEFDTVSSIARSLPARARKIIKEVNNSDRRVALFAFDVLWWRGEPSFKWKYAQRYAKLRHLLLNEVPGKKTRPRFEHLELMPIITGGLAHGIDLVRMHNWEGLVAWRSDHCSMVRLNGTPDRCNCWKVKPIKEDDVVAYQFELGKGRNANVVGKFLIGYHDQRHGTHSVGRLKFKPMGKCGTGLSDQQRKDALKWKYPCVIQIEYDRKSEKGFRFPTFMRRRTDKDPSECVG